MEIPSTDDRAIWDLWLSQYQLPVVLAAEQLGVFECLRQGPATLDELCDRLGLLRRSAAALTATLAAAGFLVQHDSAFQLTQTARLYLLRDSEFYWIPMLGAAGYGHMTTEALMRNLRTENLGEDDRVTVRWERGEMSPQEAHAANERFHSHSFPSALGLARSHDFSDVRRLLEVAGGSGCYSIALALQNPKLRCTVADLPPVAADARTYIAKYQCEDRVDTHAFNMFDDAWPTGYDAVLMTNILHDWDPRRRSELAASAFSALPSGGRMFIHEILLNDAQDGPLPAALFSVMMLSTRGKQLSFLELEELAREAGFATVEVQHTYGYYSLFTATKR
ncbi:MAG: methyltransferase [Chloroflexi bacterium]|nr:methyltransferase [Chloroflexota bacterium]MBV9893547.1 methyltransferase [Chloroflexota bacterium]